jgi:antitoxin (DNA-binding transcriptional repressor) of toxin-antitoxin stability system
MTKAGVAELKASLSKYLDRVQAGEEIVVTDRGRPIALLTRLPEASPEVDRLVRNGVVRPARERLAVDRVLGAKLPRDPKGRVRDALIEERESGR